MQPTELIAHGQTRLLASDCAARVLAVAEEGLAEAALHGPVCGDEIVEVLFHGPGIITHSTLAETRRETTRAQGHP